MEEKKQNDKKYIERRKYPRVPITTHIKFRKIEVEEKFVELKDVETNVSGGGFLFLPENSIQLELTSRLASSSPPVKAQ